MVQPLDAAEAARYGAFVDAAYAMFYSDPKNLTPKAQGFPAGYEMIAWIQMSDFGFGDVSPKFYGFIAQNITDHSSVLALRGTSNPLEWWDDFHAMSVPFRQVPNAGHVADGFDKIYDTLLVVECAPAPGSVPATPPASFATQVAGALRNKAALQSSELQVFDHALSSLVVVGHSLGAALCTLYVLENATKQLIVNPVLCTFASPRVGNASFVNTFNALDLTSWRIVNAPDFVPNLPPDIFGFQHINVLSLFNSTGKVKSSLSCAHDMATYLSLLDPALQPAADCRNPATP